MSNRFPWLKLHRKAINSPKFGLLSSCDRGVWVSLLLVADEQTGVLPDLRTMAFLTRLDQDEIERGLSALVAAGLIDVIDGAVGSRAHKMHDFEQHQAKSADSAERVKRHRDSKKAVAAANKLGVKPKCNVTVTPLESDKEREEDKTINLGQSNPTAAREPVAEGGATAPDRPKFLVIDGSKPDQQPRPRQPHKSKLTPDDVAENARRIGLPEGEIIERMRAMEHEAAKGGVNCKTLYAADLLGKELMLLLRLWGIKSLTLDVVKAALRGSPIDFAKVQVAFDELRIPMGQTTVGKAVRP